MKGKPNGVPDRWLDYSPVGKRLDGTRFIAFKVPLKQALTRQLSSSQVFGHWELLDTLSQQNQELGLIIDLTNTRRYYHLQDVPESVLVVKILTAGHHIPSDATILSFKRAVRSFLRENDDNDKLIGVHCTHGLNRTGYLICRYLIDVDGMDPDEAMQLFNSSRGHDMERQNYVTDLREGPRRSNEGMEDPEQDPRRGEAVDRPGDASPDHRGPPPHTRNHRFSPRRPTHFRHRNDHYDFPTHPPPPVGPPGYPRTPPHSEWKRYPPQEEGRYRYPPREEGRYRYPPQEEGRYRYPPREEGRYRYPPREEGRGRYPPQEEGRGRYPPREEGRGRYPPQEEGRGRYPPPQSGWSHMQQPMRRNAPPPSLPRYSPHWANGCDGGEGSQWTSPPNTHGSNGPHGGC